MSDATRTAVAGEVEADGLGGWRGVVWCSCPPEKTCLVIGVFFRCSFPDFFYFWWLKLRLDTSLFCLEDRNSSIKFVALISGGTENGLFYGMTPPNRRRCVAERP